MLSKTGFHTYLFLVFFSLVNLNASELLKEEDDPKGNYILSHDPNPKKVLASQQAWLDPALRLHFDETQKRTLLEGAVFVDYGCGSGEINEVVKEYIGEAGKYIGIDISSKAIEQATLKCPQAAFEHIKGLDDPICQMNLKKANFVFLRLVTVHQGSIEQQKSFLKKILDSMKMGSILMIEEPYLAEEDRQRCLRDFSHIKHLEELMTLKDKFAKAMNMDGDSNTGALICGWMEDLSVEKLFYKVVEVQSISKERLESSKAVIDALKAGVEAGPSPFTMEDIQHYETALDDFEKHLEERPTQKFSSERLHMYTYRKVSQ